MRSVSRYVDEFSDMELTLPDWSIDVSVSRVDGGDYQRYLVDWGSTDAGTVSITLQLEWLTDEYMPWTVFVTHGWQADATYELPDLTSLPAWNATWAPAGQPDFESWVVQAIRMDVQTYIERSVNQSWLPGDEFGVVTAVFGMD